jgi:hypothetical protein
MISARTEALSLKDRQAVLKWMNSKEALIFLGSLRSEHAVQMCLAAEIFDKHSNDIARGGAIPSTALPHLKQAAILKCVIDQFVERNQLQEEQPLITTKIIIE